MIYLYFSLSQLEIENENENENENQIIETYVRLWAIVLKQSDRIAKANINFIKLGNVRMGQKHTEIY